MDVTFFHCRARPGLMILFHVPSRSRVHVFLRRGPDIPPIYILYAAQVGSAFRTGCTGTSWSLYLSLSALETLNLLFRAVQSLLSRSGSGLFRGAFPPLPLNEPRQSPAHSSGFRLPTLRDARRAQRKCAACVHSARFC